MSVGQQVDWAAKWPEHSSSGFCGEIGEDKENLKVIQIELETLVLTMCLRFILLKITSFLFNNNVFKIEDKIPKIITRFNLEFIKYTI